METIQKNPSFLKVSKKYLVNQDFIVNMVGTMIYLYQNKSVLCEEEEMDMLYGFLLSMGTKKFYKKLGKNTYTIYRKIDCKTLYIVLL